MENVKVPIIKPGVSVDVTLSTQEIIAILQAIFLISEKWTTDDVAEIKKTLEEKRVLNDSKQITFVLLDGIYRRILKKAIDLGLTEETELPNP